MSNMGTYYFVAGIRSDAVSNATGKEWREWFTILDKAGASGLSYPDITRYLSEAQGLSGWWSQMVTVGYEEARGRRAAMWAGEEHKTRSTRTYPVPRSQLYQAWAMDAERSCWLPGQPFLIRKAVPEESMRITWSDRISGVNVQFSEIGPGRSRLHIEHVRLGSAEQANTLQAYWTAALERLDHHVTNQRAPDYG